METEFFDIAYSEESLYFEILNFILFSLTEQIIKLTEICLWNSEAITISVLLTMFHAGERTFTWKI